LNFALDTDLFSLNTEQLLWMFHFIQIPVAEQ